MNFMGKKDAAKYLGVSEVTLMAWVRAGKFPKGAITYLGRTIKFVGEVLDTWLLNGGTGKPAVRKGGFAKKAEKPAKVSVK